MIAFRMLDDDEDDILFGNGWLSVWPDQVMVWGVPDVRLVWSAELGRIVCRA